MEKYHRLLGHVRDYLTGTVVEDTHDGRYRQKLARILVEEKGYLKTEIEAGRGMSGSVRNRVKRIGPDMAEREARILYALEVEGSCGCEGSV